MPALRHASAIFFAVATSLFPPPVSYTHLDVYKRQVSVGSGNDGAGFGHANGSSYPADAELAIGYPEPSLSIDLDVYKRQASTLLTLLWIDM